MADTSKSFQPYVPATQSMAEFTAKAIVLGVLFGLLFGASTVYLGLRAGLTVSASIPIAVLAISVLKKLGGSTILENNIVQTIGSAGESVAGGVVFTIPALIFLLPDGPAYFNYTQILMLSFAGGILGVLMMVPLRRALIVKEHGLLPYPEGTACAEVLVAGERGGQLATLVFSGLGIGALWKSLSWTFNIFRQEIGHSLARTSQFPNATLNVDISPEYMGVGYVIGPRIAGTMVAGGVLSWLVLLPLLSLLGAAITTPFPPIHPNFANNPATGQPFLISEMSPGQIWSAYIRYIGAGAVLAAGLITLARTLPTIISSAREGLKGFGSGAGGTQTRTERDMPMMVVLVGSLLLAIFLAVGARPADAGQHPGLDPDRAVRLLLRHGLVAHHRPDRLLVQSDFGHDHRDADHHLPDLRRARLDRRCLRSGRALGRRHRLHRGRECRQHLAGPEDRLHRRRDADLSAARPGDWRRHVGVRDRHDGALPAQRLHHRIRGRRRAAGHADGHAHQGPAVAEPAVGPGAGRRVHRRHARTVRRALAVVRGRCVPADRHHGADLRRRPGALVGRAQDRRRRANRT